jgi:hypothetical protein
MKQFLATFLHDRLRIRESWVIFFTLGIIMMNYPFIDVFNKEKTLFGMPWLYLYFNLGWLVSIGIIYLFKRASTTADRQKGEGGRR